MDERILKYLYDVKNAINEIDSYFDESEKNFFNYQKNLMLKRAIERDLEIIGEAVNRILKSDPSFQDKITSAKSIIGLRNLVIHAYDSVSDESIWSVLIFHVPPLKIEIEQLIENSPTS